LRAERTSRWWTCSHTIWGIKHVRDDWFEKHHGDLRIEFTRSRLQKRDLRD
jgi:hypothetical protein